VTRASTHPPTPTHTHLLLDDSQLVPPAAHHLRQALVQGNILIPIQVARIGGSVGVRRKRAALREQSTEGSRQ
jgi:hypothetical protein